MKGYKRFKAYLVEHDIRQTEIAELLGVSKNYVNRVINGVGNSDFSGKEIKMICDTYQISSEIFF